MAAGSQAEYHELVRRAVARTCSSKGPGGIPVCTTVHENGKCDRYGQVLQLRWSELGRKKGSAPAYDNQEWKCCSDNPEHGCKKRVQFGIPISNEVLEREKKMRGGSRLAPDNPTLIEELGLTEDEVLDNLRDLGYIDN